MNIKTKLSVALGTLTLLILALGIFAYSSIIKLEKQNQIFSDLASANTTMYQARLAQADFMLLKENRFKTSVARYLDRTNSLLGQVKDKMEIQQSIDKVNAITNNVNEFKSAFANLVSAIDSNNSDAETNAAKVLFQSANKVSDMTEGLLNIESGVAADVRSSVNVTIVVVIVLALALSIALTMWLLKCIITPLNQSLEFADRIAKGDLTYQLAVNGNDEFCSLNKALNESSTVIKNTISTTLDAIVKLTELVESVGLSAKDSNKSMIEQQKETEQLAAAINEMSASIVEISQNTRNASNSSSEAESASTKGVEIVGQASDGVRNLSQDLEKASGVVDRLSNDSNNIADIVNVIRGIADQTNLLALNAAIEAARAGEQGRGFAVVADEVRTLAQRTQDSISEITTIIESIQVGASDVVLVMQTSNTQSSEVDELTNKASESYADITAAVAKVAEMNAQVAVGTQQQSAVTEELNVNVLRIKQLADENTHNLAEIERQLAKQSNQMHELKQIVAFFKV